MFENNNKNLPKIVVPTLFSGGIQPEEAKDGDVWIKDKGYEYDFFVYLGKWFPIINTKQTGYTEEQEMMVRKSEEKWKSEQEKKIEKYESIFKNLKEVLKCMN